MYSRWLAAGIDAEIQVLPGGVHGFDLYPTSIAREARSRMNAFLCASAAA
jgi:acetyl esterase/lipase